MKNTRLSKGFTLIELLIVITIIGILAVALLPSVLGAPARARDAARKADLNNIIAAIETFNSDEQRYPNAGAAAGSCLNGLGGSDDLSGYFQNASIPADPQGKGVGACGTSYLYCRNDGTPASYLLASFVEAEGNGNAMVSDLSGLAGCNDGTGAAPALTDPDGTSPAIFVVVK